MFRPVVSYMLTSLILLSQVGIPLHMHYCKGILEKVSVFFKPECDNHEEIADLPACCQKAPANHCTPKQGKCCDDEIKLLTQDITSLLPQFVKWVDFTAEAKTQAVQSIPVAAKINTPFSFHDIGSDSGPPIYILHQALIFYA